MDRLRCPDFPCDYSNCVIMEVGAEWPSVEARQYKATGSMSPSFLSPYRGAEWDGVCVHERPRMQFSTPLELVEAMHFTSLCTAARYNLFRS